MQQLHPDQNIPADAVRMLQHAQVFAAYNICCSLKLEHDGKLMHKVFDNAVKIGLGLRNAHALGDHACNLRSALRHGDHFQRRLIGLPEFAALNFKNPSVTALTQFVLDDPRFKYSGADTICMIHFCSSHNKFNPSI